MAEYDFSTLNSTDLEKLVCDLLNENLPPNSSVRYKTFKDGKDKGIDFLYETANIPYNHVGQVKHYYRTGYPGLVSHLKNTEVSKVRRLAPKKYIFATSVDLSEDQSETIKQIFSPYLKALNDIYGKADLNRLLQSKPNVLSAHFKLWFSDTTVIQKVLQSGMYYRTADFVADELSRRLRIYVETPILEKAKDALEKDKFVVITGEPGVGKSTLAEILVYQYLQKGYELLHINHDINEAENFLRPDDSEQVIYFDDFLGSNKAEMNKAQGSETALLSVLRRVIQRTNKRLIFTTRVHVLNSALDDSEKLTRSKFKTGQTVLNLDEYDPDLKEMLFANHIEEAIMHDEFKAVLREREVTGFIIKHKNFNPRSVEYITNEEKIKRVPVGEYKRFIMENFNDPSEIWGHAYRKQIENYERVLLNTLYTFDEPTSLKNLEAAYNKRLELDPIEGVPLSPFNTAISRLENGLIHIKNSKVDFQNPSLKDFLNKFLKDDPHELKRMINSVRYINQFSTQLIALTDFQKIKVDIDMAEELLANPDYFIRSDAKDHDLIHLATFIQANLVNHNKENTIVEIINKIDDWEELHKDYSLSRKFKEFLQKTGYSYKIQEALRERTAEIVDDLVLSEQDVFSAVDLLEDLQSRFDIDFEEYDNKAIVQHLEMIFDEHIDNELEWLLDFITDEGEAGQKHKEISELVERIEAMGIKFYVNLDGFNKDWHEVATDNYIREQMAKDN